MSGTALTQSSDYMYNIMFRCRYRYFPSACRESRHVTFYMTRHPSICTTFNPANPTPYRLTQLNSKEPNRQCWSRPFPGISPNIYYLTLSALASTTLYVRDFVVINSGGSRTRNIWQVIQSFDKSDQLISTLF